MKTSSDSSISVQLLTGVRSMCELADRLAALNYPLAPDLSSSSWVAVISTLQDDVQGESRVNLHAYLLVAGLRVLTSDSWTLVGAILPELKYTISLRMLPYDASEILNNGLQKFRSASPSDIERRILLSLAQLRFLFPDDRGVLDILELSTEERRVVLFGIEQEQATSNVLPFWF